MSKLKGCFRYDRLGMTGLVLRSLSHSAQLGAVVSFVAEELAGCLDATDETLGRWAITARHHRLRRVERNESLWRTASCVDLGRASAARAADGLFRSPLMDGPPLTERAARLQCGSD